MRYPFMINEGKNDRLVRLSTGILTSILVLLTTGWLQILLIVLSLVMFLTAATGFCGLYSLFGINTSCKKKQTD